MLAVFPAGPTGVALLLLRVCACAQILIIVLSLHAQIPAVRIGLLILALGILVGFLARICAFVAALICIGVLLAVSHATWADTALRVCDGFAIALAGPGAASIDAIFFGRRVIDLGRKA